MSSTIEGIKELPYDPELVRQLSQQEDLAVTELSVADEQSLDVAPQVMGQLTFSDDEDEEHDSAGPMYSPAGFAPLPPREGKAYTIADMIKGLAGLDERLVNARKLKADHESARALVPLDVERAIELLEAETQRLRMMIVSSKG